MPKVTKKQKEKAKDFSKAKLKLGKGKQVANNATDTSFKARSIALPSQNPLHRAIQVEEQQSSGSTSSTPTSRRGVTFTEALLTLRHPNAGARKDALGEVKEILVNGVEGGVAMGRREGEVGKVLGVSGVVRLVADEDAGVRKAFLSFIGWYLPLLPADIIPPHLPLLFLQISSGLSHIFPQIRLDACRLINILLSVVPNEVVGSWPLVSRGSTVAVEGGERSSGSAAANGEILIEGLRSAIGIGGTKGAGSHTGLNLLPATKLVTLQTILTFIRQAMIKHGLPVAGAGVNRSKRAAKQTPFPTGIFEAYEEGSWSTSHPLGIPSPGHRAEQRRTMALQPDPYLGADGINDWGIADLDWAEGATDVAGWDVKRLNDDGDGEMDMSELDVGSVLATLYLSLHPLLLSILLEAAPAAFSPSGNRISSDGSVSVDLQLCAVVAELAVAAAGTALKYHDLQAGQGSELKKAIVLLTGKMAAWFPFEKSLSRVDQRNADADELYQTLSISYAELILTLPPPVKALPPRLKSSNPNALVMQIEAAYKGSAKLRTRPDEQAIERVAGWLIDVLAPRKDVLQPALSPDAYAALLPLVWSLMVQPPGLPLAQRSSGSVEDSVATSVGVAFVQHLLRTGHDSITRRLGNHFVARVSMIHDLDQPRLPFYVPAGSPLRPLLMDWLKSIPRCLWELNNQDGHATSLLLRFLLRTAQKGSSLFERNVMSEVQGQMAPYFHIEHQARGPIAGPWHKLTSPDLRRLAADVMFALSSNNGSTLGLQAVGQAATLAGPEDASHWQSLVAAA